MAKIITSLVVIILALTLMVALVLSTGRAHASCSCECINGRQVPVCSTFIEIRPICPITMCPIPPVSIQPGPVIQVPPVGGHRCYQAQVFDRYFNQYVWRQVCI